MKASSIFKTQGRRWWLDRSGARYIAEDVVVRRGLQPQHAIWINDAVEWISHKQGAVIEPFSGPADVFLELTADARQHDS